LLALPGHDVLDTHMQSFAAINDSDDADVDFFLL
jgi:hypothetical protein